MPDTLATGFWARAIRHRSFVVGGALTLLLLGLAALSLVWTPKNPYAIVIRLRLRPPSADYWLGTDPFGRDVASLLMTGAQNSIAVGVVAVGIGLLLGTALGLTAAARRGWLEELIMRLSDFTFAFPAILSAIMITAILGAGATVAISSLPVFAGPRGRGGSLAEIGRLTMPIFLLHVLFIAGCRIVLARFAHLTNPAVLLVILVAAGLIGPLLTERVLRPLKLQRWLGF